MRAATIPAARAAPVLGVDEENLMLEESLEGVCVDAISTERTPPAPANAVEAMDNVLLLPMSPGVEDNKGERTMANDLSREDLVVS